MNGSEKANKFSSIHFAFMSNILSLINYSEFNDSAIYRHYVQALKTIISNSFDNLGNYSIFWYMTVSIGAIKSRPKHRTLCSIRKVELDCVNEMAYSPTEADEFSISLILPFKACSIMIAPKRGDIYCLTGGSSNFIMNR